MAANLKELSALEMEGLAPGHRMCAGCGAPLVVRQILMAAGGPVAVANATGCLEVATTIYPHTAWNVSWIHSAFENAPATLSGIEAAYRSLRRRGRVTEEIKFVGFSGDGGTYDIGIQALSGALERGHNLVWVCYDNGAYMNTGNQRSSATPTWAASATTPATSLVSGKQQSRKNLTDIVAAHHIPYVAQASPSHWRDLIAKAEKAFRTPGPAFLNIISPCVPGWGYDTDQTVDMARLAVETCYWPLYEIENDRYRITYTPKQKRPVVDWLKPQGRFKHMFREDNGEHLAGIQTKVDADWQTLQQRADGHAGSNS